jgi:hypothetical protein
VLKNPDDLADIVPAGRIGILELEEYSYVALDVWMMKTGLKLSAFYDVLDDSKCEPPSKEPSGKGFRDDSHELQAAYPKLWRRFGRHPLW